MECTQRLECTQDADDIYSERVCPEQIGFLGICGSKQPVKKGPNKVGRDPQTCAIVLDDNSISRQHAVINILNKKDFMLMDLDSSNKTKLMGKILQPYIPHPLKNGDTVQFGQVFGIFRLLEEDDVLPMTQAVEIPDTPINTRHISRLRTAPITTVPESPDVSDRDDSIIAQSQLKNKTDFKSPNKNFIKSGKTTGVPQIGTNKIDNVYWNSSKKSDSFNSKFESSSGYTINKNSVSPKTLPIESSIYDMETQAPAVPDVEQTSDSIYEANTQVPNNLLASSIYTCNTQVPNKEKLPEVFKIQHQNNVHLNLYSTNEKFNIFDAETQVTFQNEEKKDLPKHSNAIVTDNQNYASVSSINKKLNSSDEEICFDEIDCHQLEDECGSQPLLPPNPCVFENPVTSITNPEKEKIIFFETNEPTNKAVLNDCEDIAPSQKTPVNALDDEDVTDCEDNMLELGVNIADKANKIQSDDDVTDCEDDLSNVEVNSNKKTAGDDDLTDCEDDVIEISQNRSKTSNSYHNLEDLPTQLIGEENIDEEKKSECRQEDVLFEDMLTQVIEEHPIQNHVTAHKVNNTDKSIPFEDLQTQVIDIVISQEQSKSTPILIRNNNSFKRPLSSPNLKKKDAMTFKSSKSTATVIKNSNFQKKDEDDPNYYDATQQIINDLCTQNERLDNFSGSKMDKNNLSTDRNDITLERSPEDSDPSERIHSFVSKLSDEQVREVIGADPHDLLLNKNKFSDSSDLEVTPKKFNSSKFLMIDLPNTQEIQSCEFVSSKVDIIDSSDGLEDADEQDNTKNTPPKGYHRRRKKKDIKVDLMKKFDFNTLSTRTTRIRKPASKILDSDKTTKKMSEKIVQSKISLHKKQEVDEEVIQLNLKPPNSKTETAKSKTSSSSRKSNKDEKGKTTKEKLSKHDQQEQSLQKSDSKKSKDHMVAQKNNKELKQKNIKSMFKEPNSKGDMTGANMETDLIDSSHKKNRRSSRNKSKGDQKEVTDPGDNELNLESRDKKLSSRNQTSRKEVKKNDSIKNQETEVRRSRRHQTTKEKIENNKEKEPRNKRRNKSNETEKRRTATSENRKTDTAINEESAVYNLSSETTVNSPNNLKRSATSDIFPSKTKKAKSKASNSLVRATPSRGIRTQRVLFTAFPCEEVKLKLIKLGALIVSDVKSCTVVLTSQIKRTFKFLCALGLGKPIVGPNWVQACVDSNMIVDPWLYLLKDEATERRFGFNLRQSLTCKRNFLKGYNVFCTPHVLPNAEEMKSIVECSGGTWKEGGMTWFCVTCPADKGLWSALRKRGATLVSTEFILGGVVQQRINLDRDRLG